MEAFCKSRIYKVVSLFRMKVPKLLALNPIPSDSIHRELGGDSATFYSKFQFLNA